MAGTQDLFFVKSAISNKSLSDTAFNKWYDEVHVPDVVKTSGVTSAFRYKSIDPAAEKPYLALYAIPDISFCDSEEFNSIPINDDCFAAPKHLCFDDVDFEVRLYKRLHAFEKEGAKAGLCILDNGNKV
jgi:hypothetical protein